MAQAVDRDAGVREHEKARTAMQSVCGMDWSLVVRANGLALGALILCLGAATAAAADSSQASIPGTWDAIILGQWAVPSKTKISVTFQEDGAMSAGAGCNFMWTKFAVTGRTFSKMGDLMQTAKLCDEATTLAEDKLSDAIFASREWRVENGLLVSYDENGNVVAKFKRHKMD